MTNDDEVKATAAALSKYLEAVEEYVESITDTEINDELNKVLAQQKGSAPRERE